MATRRTLSFLPEIFQTDVNKKFLSATLDQLVTEPQFTRLDGYIGRKFAPNYRPTDNYIKEVNADRQNYQLEPSLVIKDSSDEVVFYSGYTDLINKLKYYSANVTNHDRLFSAESYTYDGLFDFDKFVNYSQYYWVPTGIDPVPISSGLVSSQHTFVFGRDEKNNIYKIDDNKTNNPEITVVRGGLYKFQVTQPGSKLWIQTEIGTTGKRRALPNISSREILGINNNGQDNGVIEFRVPLVNAQDRYLKMPLAFTADYAINTTFSNIDGASFTDVVANYQGFDGMDINPNSKTVIFLNTSTDSNDWQTAAGGTVSVAHRRGVWRIRLVNNGTYADAIALDYIRDVALENKVHIRAGRTNVGIEFYRDADYNFIRIPVLTAQYDQLYYQDESNLGMYGVINIIDDAVDSINVDTSVIGKTNYTSPGGVEFTNGLVIAFDDTILPSTYANKTYIVEGVGKGIVLVDFDRLVFPEAGATVDSVPLETGPFGYVFDQLYQGQTEPDYIVCSRASKDLNAWARQNRWFHVDVITTSAIYNGTNPSFDQALRAQRPIIEFEPDIQLFNNGRIGKQPVDIIDDVINDAFGGFYTHVDSFVNEGLVYKLGVVLTSNDIVTVSIDGVVLLSSEYTLDGDTLTLKQAKLGFNLEVVAQIYKDSLQHSPSLTVNGITYTEGQRILFAKDRDPVIRSQVYQIQYKIQDEPTYKMIYDGKGVGLISTEAPILNYVSVSDPVEVADPGNLVSGVEYTWEVTGPTKLLTATRIDGFNYPGTSAAATVTEIEDLGNRQYLIHFTTPEAIDTFITWQITIRGTGGSMNVVGVNTKFTEELEIGDALYDSTDRYIGTVAFVTSDTKIRLAEPATEEFSTQEFWRREPRIQLILSEDPDDALIAYDCVVATAGTNRGVTFWYDGDIWTKAQQKYKINQTPLFDVFDFDGNSFGSSIYPSSKFVGTKLFSYKVGTGSNDSVLGFPLSYRNTSSLADIVFENNFDSNTFQYLVNGKLVPKSINEGYLRINTSRSEFNKRNVWATCAEPSKQYQVINKIYNGRTSYFTVDILPDEPQTVPTIKVFLNNVLLTDSQYSIIKVKAYDTVYIPKTQLAVGDKIDIVIYSSSTSKIGYYQIPHNLDYNSENSVLSTMSLGQLRNHLTITGQNTSNVIGQIPGSSNLRDVSIKSQGGNILQTSAPPIYASLFLISDQANFVNSLDYARREYVKFKNKFLELSSSLPGLDFNDPAASVDTILISMNQVKNTSFPWYYSDMVPYGTSYTSTVYTVVKESSRQYKISQIYDKTLLQNRGALVYHGTELLVLGKDYNFDSQRPAVIFTDSVYLPIGSKIEIREYNTDANYIPETPSKLGLYPKFVPSIFTDRSYRDPVDVIQGHDGSLTPVFNDYRDHFLLELELRIYNNIKGDETKKTIDVRNYIPGRFRSTDYSLVEFNRIISTSFLRWAGSNKLDFIAHNYFESNDPFTYNYRYSKDSIFGEAIPGWWRGIYRYFYDTDRPHTHPWEMLGFTEQPTWWVSQYGAAPYTSGNQPLWEDLELGLVRQGTRAGVNTQYIRSGLTQVIPVNEHGELLPPLGHISAKFDSVKSAESFVIGDQGPVESAWIHTSEYPFALQLAVALMKPAVYFGTQFDIDSYYVNADLGQYLTSTTHRRVTTADIKVNGEMIDGTITRSRGYVNYIADYLTSLGIDAPTKLRSLLDNLEVQLAYKIGGYTDKNYLTVLAEQYSPSSKNESVIVPNENYKVHLNKSVPVNRVVYSAVIIEKTNTGFAVSGYNTAHPYFTIVPSETTGTSYNIKVGALTGVIYNGYKVQFASIPYGFEFTTRQQVVDFLVSYQRFLASQGFIFDDFNTDLKVTQDWVLSAQEFLTWTLQGWKTGSILVLSPCNNQIKLISSYTIVDEITNTANGGRILDPNFKPIRTNDLAIIREAEAFVARTTNGSTIALAELNLTQFEHVLIFDNTTLFNDVIYKPELGSRQFRLKLIGDKTADWVGDLSPPGFIYNNTRVDAWRGGKDYLKGDIVTFKNTYYVAAQKVPASDNFDLIYWKSIDKAEIKTGLLPNFANNASRFIDVYDIDSTTLDKQMQKMSSGLIGFRSRSYFNDLNVNLTSQTKFYQGYIKEKGTKNAITALLSTQFNNLNSNSVKFFEEWAVRVGEYGAQTSNRSVEIVIDELVTQANPFGIVVIADGDTGPEGIIAVEDKNLYARSFERGPVQFLNRDRTISYENDIQPSGYVNLDDVDSTLFSSASYDSVMGMIGDIGSGYTIWVARDTKRDWDVYRTSETDNTVERVEYALDLRAKVTTKRAHDFAVGQTVLIKQLSDLIDGFYSIVDIVDRKSFTVGITLAQSNSIKASPLTGTGALFTLNSVRFDAPRDVALATPKHTWKDGDLAWVDSTDEDRWAVYEKSSPWVSDGVIDIQRGSYVTNARYGAAIRVDPTGAFIIVGSPGDQNGLGRVHVFPGDKNKKEYGLLRNGASEVYSLGFSVDVAGTHIVAGAPDSRGQTGVVLVYSMVQGIFAQPTQMLVSPTSAAGAKFGYSITQSLDSNWLYVGSPGNNSVFAYRMKEVEFSTLTFKISVGRTEYELPFEVTDPQSISVYYAGRMLVLDQDYGVIGNSIVIVSTLISEDYNQFYTEDLENEIILESSGGELGFLVVNRRSYYKYAGSIVGTNSGAQFGYSVKTGTNGELLVVGEPFATVGGKLYAGSSYVYKNTAFDEGVPEEANITFTLVEKLNADVPTYRAQFGSSVDLCKNNCSVYVGTPGYSIHGYSGGAVFRFVNTGLILGTLTGSVVNPTVTVGHSLVINDTTVTFTGTSLSSIISDINNAHILGVTARNNGGHLTIDSTVSVKYSKLDILPGTGTAIANLGFTLFATTQKITKPVPTLGEKFGSRVRIGPDAETLLISSTTGTIETYSIIDLGNTTFDGKSTQILDITLGSGSVYVHDFLSSSLSSIDQYGQFGFTGEFNAANVRFGDQFGSDMDLSSDTLVIGAEYNDSELTNAGQVYRYKNSTGKKGWSKLREEAPKVDISGINRVFLYSKKSKAILTTLDFIDPAKGKVLGIANQYIDFRTSQDPASYNAGTSIDRTLSDEFHWNSAQVGMTWWNLDAARFVDYEQGDLNYRLNNWGRLFPNSSVEVYEWTESSTLPSRYVTIYEGTPLHSDDSAYVEITSLDPATSIIKTKYYFWVRGVRQVPEGSKRTISVLGLEEVIRNPKNQGIPYAALMSDHSIALFNAQEYINGRDTVLQIDYDTVLNDNILHSEYELIQEGNGGVPVHDRIINKIVDSLSGVDAAGSIVPDVKIRPGQVTGLGLRPRQTVVLDKDAAMRNVIEYVNSVLRTTPAANKLRNSSQFESTYFYLKDPEPTASDYDYRAENLEELGFVAKYDTNNNLRVGIRVLVANDSDYFNLWTLRELQADETYKLIRNQAYDTKQLWSFDTWYATDFSSDTRPTYIVADYNKIVELTIVAGDIVKVLGTSTGGFEMYQYTSATESKLVALEHGTIKLNDYVWDQEINQVGFDNHQFDSVTHDINYSLEIRNILNGLKDDIFVDDLIDNYNRLLFVIIEYILTEQKNVDWIFKTSFISILHSIRQLEQYPTYIKDNQTYYEDYIKEVKPYRTKVRDYRSSYSGIDSAGTHATDFDLPAYYDSVRKRYRSPTGAALLQPQYSDWSNNFLNTVDNIIITNPGTGYTEAPTVTVIDSEGIDTGTTAVATVNEVTGGVQTISIVTRTSNFSGLPVVIINGNGTGATACATLTNGKIRSIKTVLKFDRVSFDTSVTEWLPNVAYTSGSSVSYLGTGYQATEDVPPGTLFNLGLFKPIATKDYKTANDRIASLYTPTKFQVPKEFDPITGNIDLRRIIPGLVPPQTITPSGGDYDTVLRSVTGSESDDGAVIVTGGGFIDSALVYAPEELIPGTASDTLSVKVITRDPDALDANVADSVGFRIFKDARGAVRYFAISRNTSTTLSSSLSIEDTEIHVTDIINVPMPNLVRHIPGTIYVNGEKINYLGWDEFTSTLSLIRRGVDGTSVANVHTAGTIVEYVGSSVVVPDTTVYSSTTYVFAKHVSTFRTSYKVGSNLDAVKNQIAVTIGDNPLTIIADYNITLDTTDVDDVRAIITLTESLMSRLVVGTALVAGYTADQIWLDIPLSGNGLIASTTTQAEFLKNNPYYGVF